MAQQKKYLFTLIAAAALLFLAAGPAQAFELQYPFVGAYSAGYYLPQYLIYVFEFVVFSAGGIGVLSLVIGGLQYIASGARPELKSQANSRILDSILGIVLLLSSVVLLGTINSELTQLQFTPSAFIPSQYIVSNVPVDSQHPTGISYQPVPSSGVADLSGITGNFTYYCDPSNPNSATVLLSLYTNKNFVHGADDTTVQLRCNGATPVAGFQSLQWAYKSTGVYFYADSGCGGAPLCKGPDCATRSDGFVPKNLQAYPASFQIVSGAKDDEKYGVVLTDESGECSMPYLNNNFDQPTDCTIQKKDTGASTMCCNMPIKSNLTAFQASYVSILQPSPYYNPDDDQNGVEFRSAHYGVFFAENIILPHLVVSAANDVLNPKRNMDYPTLDAVLNPTSDPKFAYPLNQNNPDTSGQECTPNDPNPPCLTSSNADGPYYTVLYGVSTDTTHQRRSCAIFKQPINNLFNDAQFGLGANFNLYRMDIIPYGGD